MAISNERFTTLFLNWWETVEKDMTLSDMEDICKDIGMTRDEFIELVSQSDEFISKDGWTPEPKTNEKVNTETGEGIFWKEYTEEEEEETKDESEELKATVLPIYFDFIEMLEDAKVNFTKYSAEKTIEIRDGYDTVDFIFDRETLRLKEVSF